MIRTLLSAAALTLALPALADDATDRAAALNATHADLARSGGMPAELANEAYVEALARIVYYWAYPAVDVTNRTVSMWPMTEDGPGTMFGIAPGAPENASGCLAGYLPSTQRIIVTPNNDTFYGVAFADLGKEPVVVQTPEDVPDGHYWVMQIVDVFTDVERTLGSAWGTKPGKYLLVGPGWQGETPPGIEEVSRVSTNYAGVLPRTFAARTPEGRAQAIAVQNQMGVYPLSQNTDARKTWDCEAITANHLLPPGVTEAMLAADPDAARPQWVVPERFWTDVATVLANNPTVAPGDAAMAEQAGALVALHASDPKWAALLDKAVLEADADLHASARYEQIGVDVGNGWQRQKDGGLWGADWFGRAQAAVVYILVNDWHEAVYLIRGTDAKGTLLDGRHTYTMTFPKDGLPPVDRAKGGFWSLTMYDKDYFMLADAPDGRTNLGTVNLDAEQLTFAGDGTLTLTISHAEPADTTARANWLPAPEGQFSLIIRAYVPEEPILGDVYLLPDVVRR